jgi:hypothetical protein
MKKLNILSLLIIFTGFFVSCDLDINDDPNYLKSADNNMLLSSSIAYSAASIGGDLQLIGGFWAQHYAQNPTSNQYKSIDGYYINYADYNRIWTNLWAGAMQDLKTLKSQSKADGSKNYYAVANLLMAYDLFVLADVYGSIPFDQALRADSNVFNPEFISSDKVHIKLIPVIDESIEILNGLKGTTASTTFSSYDILFGKASDEFGQWLAFARTLKLKVLMRDFAANKTLITTMLGEGGFLTTDVKMAIFEDKVNGSNPLFESDRRTSNTSVNIKASTTLMTFLKANNDPRIANYYELNTDDGKYLSVDQGNYDLETPVSPGSSSVAKCSPKDPVFFMSEVESYFLQAEAYARIDNPTQAKNFYDKGVTASFARVYNAASGAVGSATWTADASFESKAAGFLAAGGAYVFPSSGSKAAQIKAIITQKWVASSRAQAWDAFIDQNRTGYPELFPVNSVDAYKDATYVPGMLVISQNSNLDAGELPRRIPYPQASVDYNSSVPKQISIGTLKPEDMLWQAKAPITE